MASFLQGIACIKLGSKEVVQLRNEHITESHTVSAHSLLWYRVVMFTTALAVGISQLVDKGMVVFSFFTVWNWWLLTMYFALASAASIVSLQGGNPHKHKQRQVQKIGNLEIFTATLFQIVVPMAFLVDLLTWLVLVPMLMANPDPVKVLYWQELMFCFMSYMQHGVNALMVLGEMMLNRIPGMPSWGLGWISMLSSAYGVWNVIFFLRSGTFLYPFLDAHRPFAWLAYLGLYIAHCVGFLAFLALVAGRNALHRRSRYQRSAR